MLPLREFPIHRFSILEGVSAQMNFNGFNLPSPFEYVDLYCERTAPGFWNEPLNALSNIVFFLVAWSAWRRARQAGAVTASWRIPVLLTLAVGVGSFLFHTLANRWAMAMDLIPILLYTPVFLWIYSREVLNWKLGTLVGVLIGLGVASLVGLQFKQALNGSVQYLPGCFLLVGMGAIHVQRKLSEPWSLLTASGMLLTGIVFRTIDQSVCAATLGHGTHFVWHFCAGGVLYFTLKGLIANLPRVEEESV